VQGISAHSIPNVDTAKIIAAGATELRDSVPTEYLPSMLFTYNEALGRVFMAGLAMACLSMLAALALGVEEHEAGEEAGR
jgi:hypothetical protein